MSARRSVRPGSLVALAVAVPLGALLVWAASRGPDAVLHDPGGRSPGTASGAAPPTPLPGTGSGRSAPGDPSSLLTVVVAVVLALIGLALLLVVVAVLRHVEWRLPSRRDAAAPDAAAPDLTVVAAATRAITDDAAAQAALLDVGTPRNAVVACWHRFEVQAERARVPRRTAETSSEFTLRLLDLVEADASAVRRLEVLYREARFSDHELGEADRQAAREALGDIHLQLANLLTPERA